MGQDSLAGHSSIVGTDKIIVNASELRTLRQLARLNGVQTSYTDMAGLAREASPEALTAVLAALGSPVTQVADMREHLVAARRAQWQRPLEPVTIVWDGKSARSALRLPANVSGRKCDIRLRLEDGRALDLSRKRAAGSRLKPVEFDGAAYVEQTLALPSLALGYHQLEVETQEGVFRSLVVSAPAKSYSEAGFGKQWGVFLPFYATHSRRSWGAGNFSDGQKLSEWIASMGGAVAASLPLLATFLDGPICEPSPYSPASRLFWNEFYLDIESVPEFAQTADARELVRSRGFQSKLAEFRRGREIDYRREAQLRRQVLELLAKKFFSVSSPRRREFERFLKQRPEVGDYACFRAACEQANRSWHTWPERQRKGRLRPGDYDPQVQQYHSYVQWLAQEQIDRLAHSCQTRGVKLYLDLPLGVNPDGYDVWRERGVFTSGASAGAPPDLFFSKGQNWGFAPLHPEACREQGYRYVLDYLRFQMRHTGMLRIDHVMGLHRLYWVPQGMSADQGCYVRYPADELYALLCLESVRHKTMLVGEDLGTVPPEVDARMKRHGLRQMYVVQFEQRPNAREPLPPPPARSVASLNTHDMPTFAAHLRGADLADRADLGLFKPGQIGVERKRRKELTAAVIKFLRRGRWVDAKQPRADSVLRACLKWLSASDAEMLLINLEDLWLEESPQNVPGTHRERPNWRRKARFTIERIVEDNRLREMLEEVDRLRSGSPERDA